MYAADTSVSVGRTQDEIRRTLDRYGATGFLFGETEGKAMCGFAMKGKQIRIIIPVPIYGKSMNKKQYIMGQEQCAQITRSAWRCLLLAIKAKLECVESGISTFEEEFLAHIVMPDGNTVGKMILPQIDETYRTGNMPPLLGGRV